MKLVRAGKNVHGKIVYRYLVLGPLYLEFAFVKKVAIGAILNLFLRSYNLSKRKYSFDPCVDVEIKLPYLELRAAVSTRL